jgi:hypothetical protein
MPRTRAGSLRRGLAKDHQRYADLDGPGVATFGVPFGGRAFAGTVLKTAGSKWNLAAYTFPVSN